jgi:hypothetical protein
MRANRHTEKRRAIDRGLEAIYRTACDAENFEMYGFDFLGCFDCIASTSKDRNLARKARRMGRERARHWRREHAQLTADLSADEIAALVFGCCAADRLGVRDDAFKESLRAAAEHFTVADYLGFDSAIEPPPRDVPEECLCGTYNERGRKRCSQCKKQLNMLSRYGVWLDALTRSYHGERYGIRLGAPFAEVIKWLPAMRGYPTYDDGNNPDFYWAIYAVTHVVYTLNDYSFYKLSPRALPDEYAFLKSNLRHTIQMEDPESMGEFLDALKSFGLSSDHRLIQEGENFILATQNSDGSWGDPSSADHYQRYHPTWTAIDGLRDYAWWGGLRRLSKRNRHDL